MPDDDLLLGQNDVDVRNEARNPLNEMPIQVDKRIQPGTVLVTEHGVVKAGIENISFACRNPEQAWIEESRAEAEREDTSARKGQAD